MASAARDVGMVGAVFVGVAVLAELLGAANMGTALSFAQIAFAAVLIWMLLTR